MNIFKTSVNKLHGTTFKDVHKKALEFYKLIKNKSKRRPYIRSAYFNKQKIFIDIFWHHLFEKDNWRDRMRRLKYFPAAIDLISKSQFEPQTKVNPNKRSELLHRFKGITVTGDVFFVHIKEDKNSREKFLISIFPE